MNKRIKKKLEKRNGHFHYKDYRYWLKVDDIIFTKYGKHLDDYTDTSKGYKRNMLYIKHRRNFDNPVDVTIYRNVYPAGIGGQE